MSKRRKRVPGPSTSDHAQQWQHHPLFQVFYQDIAPLGANIYDSSLGEWNIIEQPDGSLFWRATPPNRYLTTVQHCISDLDAVPAYLVKLSTVLGTFFVVSGDGLLEPKELQLGNRPEFLSALVRPDETRFVHCGKNVHCDSVPAGCAICFPREDSGRITYSPSAGKFSVTVFDRFYVLRAKEPDFSEKGLVSVVP